MRSLWPLVISVIGVTNYLSAEPPKPLPPRRTAGPVPIVKPVPNTGDIILFDIATSNLMNPDPLEDLIGGTPAKPEEWPSSFASSQGNSRCTATLIGPQALQLAAHCVGNGRTSSITISGKSYTGTCTHHPKYKSDDTADWALCKMSEAVDRPWYERVLEDVTKIKVGTKVLLAGNGCTNIGGSNGSFGTFRTGESTVKSLPVRDYDTITSGGAALCYGDSGGSAFYVEGLARWIFGVNSRGNIRDTSYLSSTYVDVARSWYKSWADQAGVKICGVHPDAPKCQGGDEPEPENPLPEHCTTSYQKIHGCLWGVPRQAISKPEECRAEVANLVACEEIAEREE